jgi:hypothetical protein
MAATVLLWTRGTYLLYPLRRKFSPVPTTASVSFRKIRRLDKARFGKPFLCLAPRKQGGTKWYESGRCNLPRVGALTALDGSALMNDDALPDGYEQCARIVESFIEGADGETAELLIEVAKAIRDRAIND